MHTRKNYQSYQSGTFVITISLLWLPSDVHRCFVSQNVFLKSHRNVPREERQTVSIRIWGHSTTRPIQKT